ncbi:MAG: penicillin acylase family protein [Candidatus Promineifilaceae bacterium]
MDAKDRLLVSILKSTFTYLGRRRFPQDSGRIYVGGLEDVVTVDRDKWGIPHIFARKRPDLFFAQGFVHAQDRLWQLEINRRAAKGELSALLGPSALETDRLTRTLGFAHVAADAWESASDSTRADVEAYTAGVNAYLLDNHPLPVEFTILRHRPDFWEPVDSVSFAHLMVWTLSHGWAGELTRARIIEQAGPEVASALEPAYPQDNPITLPHGIEFNGLSIDGMLLAASGPFLSRAPEGNGRGSNGWVISREHSATGHALLCNDMHLPMSAPSIWYFNHLRSESSDRDLPGIHVSGVSLPGLPYVLIGHNKNIAWGATLSFVDCEDLFVERLNPENNDFYLYKGNWIKADIRNERIEVKGATDHVERVITTRHGPIISPMIRDRQQVLALQSTALLSNQSFDGFALINEARDWNDFIEAVKRIESPSLNLLYADRMDNIGYFLSGRVPIRAKGQGLVPSPGWSGEYDWIGEVPFEEMPHALNPKEGLIVTANNRIVDDDFPHFLGSVWVNGYRARRITELLRQNVPVSLADCGNIQMDLKSIPGIELVDRLADFESNDPDAAQAMLLLRQWDGWLGPKSVGGAVYQVFLSILSRDILEPCLGQELADEYLGTGPNPVLMPITEFHGQWIPTLLGLLEKPSSTLWAGERGYTAIVERSLVRTVEELRKHLGADPAEWRWGRLHFLTFDHVMAQRTPLGDVFSPGPFPVGGDTNTVLQTAVAPSGSFGTCVVAPSYRQIIDMGNLDSTRAMYAPGQSGWLESHHYEDLVDPWLKGESFPMTQKKEGGDASMEQNLLLIPKAHLD